MPTKEEISERLQDAIEEHEDVEAIGEALLEEEVAVEVGEELATQVADSNGETRSSSAREYFIFKLGDSEEWNQVAEITASTAEGAVRSLGEEILEEGDVYAAVPSRNWNVLPPVKKRTTISF